MPIHTPRLTLLPGDLRTLEAELRGPDALAAELGVAVDPSWPPPLYDEDAVRWMLEHVIDDPGWLQWGFRYFVYTGSDVATAVGAGGFKGPPEEGAVEIGYSIVPEYQRRGLATEAARGMVARAFESSEVDRVLAETLPELIPSIGVLERCGFALEGEGSEPGVVRYALSRAAWRG